MAHYKLEDWRKVLSGEEEKSMAHRCSKSMTCISTFQAEKYRAHVFIMHMCLSCTRVYDAHVFIKHMCDVLRVEYVTLT